MKTIAYLLGVLLIVVAAIYLLVVGWVLGRRN